MKPKEQSTQIRMAVSDCLPGLGRDNLIRMIGEGLASSPRRISSMFFYDDFGSELFDRITCLPEYYPTRTEMELLEKLACSFAENLTDCDIIELGSGNCSKISLLLDAVESSQMKSVRYVPVDVSKKVVEESAVELVGRYPDLTVHGFVADFCSQLDILPHDRRRVFCFLGGTLGNFHPEQRAEFLQSMASSMGPKDSFLLGVDMVKPKDILEKAYDDGSNVTAQFNRNILNVVNDITGTDFDPLLFRHVSFYNEEHARIEMHLEALQNMFVSSPFFDDLDIRRGERILTEYSHKFTSKSLSRLMESVGLSVDFRITDINNWYSVLKLKKI
ncbi:MAG: L-histidine N(alpha)-methyltransferase [Chitinispirillaceae bacterium]